MKKRVVSITILVITIAAFFTACDLDARVGAMFVYAEGLQYFENASTEQDYEQAVSLFRKAAEAGHPGAQFMLGACYVLGKGVKADNTRAVSWLKKVAEEVTIHWGIVSFILTIIVIRFIFKNILVPLCKAASKAIVWVVQVIKWILARVLLIIKKAAERNKNND
ncbi:MAG: SEL1-like repeat protein [Treponematales bacterium]